MKQGRAEYGMQGVGDDKDSEGSDWIIDGRATWIGINQFVSGIDNETISNSWLAENIQQGHGPLGALYPDVAGGMEGDTPAFLSLIPNGLSVPERPNWRSADAEGAVFHGPSNQVLHARGLEQGGRAVLIAEFVDAYGRRR